MMILKEFSRIVCVSLFSYQGSLLVCLSDSLFTLPHLIDCVKCFFEVFYFSKFKTSNGEGGIWTLAPLLTTYSLSRGAPSASLGTSPNRPTQSLLFSEAFYIISRCFLFVKNFFKFFQNFLMTFVIRCLSATRLLYHIHFWMSSTFWSFLFFQNSKLQTEKEGFEPSRRLPDLYP